MKEAATLATILYALGAVPVDALVFTFALDDPEPTPEKRSPRAVGSALPVARRLPYDLRRLVRSGLTVTDARSTLAGALRRFASRALTTSFASATRSSRVIFA